MGGADIRPAGRGWEASGYLGRSGFLGVTGPEVISPRTSAP